MNLHKAEIQVQPFKCSAAGRAKETPSLFSQSVGQRKQLQSLLLTTEGKTYKTHLWLYRDSNLLIKYVNDVLHSCCCKKESHVSSGSWMYGFVIHPSQNGKRFVSAKHQQQFFHTDLFV